MKPTDDDFEMAEGLLARGDITLPRLALFVAEIRTEQVELDALICEHYADSTTFVRKSKAAKECAVRIREQAAEHKGAGNG